MRLKATIIQKNRGLALCALLIGLFAGCSSDPDSELQVDVSGVEARAEFTRLAPLLYEGPRATFRQRLDSACEQYPELMNTYTGKVIGIGPAGTDTNARILKRFVYDQYWQKVYQEIRDQYSDLTALQQELERAFKHYRYYYPEATIPEIYTMVKGIDLRYKVATLDRGALILFLDMYLGRDYKYYPSQYPDYRIERFQRTNITPDVMETLFQARYPEDSMTNRTFLSKMLYKGKKLYFMKAMMPDRHDTAIMRYSLDDWQWCLNFEAKLWNHFVSNELLYETNTKKYSAFLKEAPFTSAGGIPPESPPRLGAFTGWRIIQNYRNNKDEQSLPSLMNNRNHKQILTKSGYNP